VRTTPFAAGAIATLLVMSPVLAQTSRPAAPRQAQQTPQAPQAPQTSTRTGPEMTDADRATAALYSVKEALALQVTLDKAGFSPGEIDGKLGKNTLRALEAYEGARGHKATPAENGGLREYTLTKEDVAGPFTKVPADMMEKAKLKALNYASALEMLGERFHIKPELLRQINPGRTFVAGETIKVPDVEDTPMPDGRPEGQAVGTSFAGNVTVYVSKSRSSLQVLDNQGNVVFRAPVTTGSEKDPLPLGTWQVTGVSRNPIYNYNPALFWDADPQHAKARVAPGPNNPVGVVWIDLSKEHYGIHGTPEPGRISYSESHGCVRLTNWDALRVAALVDKGTPVIFIE
jgi:lipoprotein-anchoring transpeptidase ErfK/SrfK